MVDAVLARHATPAHRATGGRLVIVSNRLADPRKPAAGGLAVAIGEALQISGGLWFGWSGKVVDAAAGGVAGECTVHTHQAGNVTLVSADLSSADHDTYYRGYANGVLWPLFHYRLDLVDFNPAFEAGYRRVNRMLARELLKLLRDDDTVWIHDYHMIPLAAELRALGSKHRIGFFLHVPLPPQLIVAALPAHAWLMRSLFACDVVGFQSEADLLHFARYAVAEAGAETLSDGRFRLAGRTLIARSFPIGIDVDEFLRLGQSAEALETDDTLREQYGNRKLLLGVDRIDYSKGLPQRIRTFRELLERYPENCKNATLIQIASPSREDVSSYTDIVHELESLCGEINGNYGELDWVPVRYIHRTVARRRLPAMCRAARVALVTPLRDGMNLVAKEYVAAQDPEDPGVLVLSRFAGAAEQMHEALLVNPFDIHSTADVVQAALTMPLAERVRRHRALLERIREHDVHWWRRTFLSCLEAVEVAR